MKKRLSLILALLLVVLTAFSGCGELSEDLLPDDSGSFLQEIIDGTLPQDETDPLPEDSDDSGESGALMGGIIDVTLPEDAEGVVPNAPWETEGVTEPAEDLPDPDGSYTTKEDVALYIYTYGELPANFMTKKEARSLGWEGGGLDRYAEGMCIGGDRFGNYEGLLPDADGRTWTECDIDTLHAKSRGAKRIVFSNDGLIYYTGDHYESFELLYGEP